MRKVPTMKHIVVRLENRFNDLTEFADMYHELVASQIPEGASNNCKEIPGDNL